jgi:hypothetical protein
MTNVSDKICRENLAAHLMFNHFFKKNSAFCGIRIKNIAELDRPQMEIWSMLIACCIFKATKTHSEQVYVILIAFPPDSFCVNASQY